MFKKLACKRCGSSLYNFDKNYLSCTNVWCSEIMLKEENKFEEMCKLFMGYEFDRNDILQFFFMLKNHKDLVLKSIEIMKSIDEKSEPKLTKVVSQNEKVSTDVEIGTKEPIPDSISIPFKPIKERKCPYYHFLTDGQYGCSIDGNFNERTACSGNKIVKEEECTFKIEKLQLMLKNNQKFLDHTYTTNKLDEYGDKIGIIDYKIMFFNLIRDCNELLKK